MVECEYRPADKAQNRLLAALPPFIAHRLQTQMQVVPLAARQILYGPDAPLEYVFFPLTGLISLVVNFQDGFQAEVGLVGADGMVGLSICHGVTLPMSEAMVQAPGEALRMKASLFRRELDAQPELGRTMLRYSEIRRNHAMQTAACNGHHSLEKRLARWLLTVHDLTQAADVPITQELLAMMLCVHRPSVTVAVGRLQRAGLIRQAAGRLAILNRPGLEQNACECYSVIRRRSLVVFG